MLIQGYLYTILMVLLSVKKILPLIFSNIELNNYPNPFNPETIISFNIPFSANVKIEVFNTKGQKICSLVNDYLQAGKHSIIWNGKDNNNQSVASGIYFYRIHTNYHSSIKKMVMLK